mmetsp:Transcript_5393/g.9057  ORF Transcript_5393/g.9057 Transcript_5393/m.9057 type:complete len:155 (-) Transcript_5393:59-523(-)
MNGYKRTFIKKYFTSRMMPESIDTFAITEPNKRYYKYLKIWDKNGGKGGKKIDWSKHEKDGRTKGFVADSKIIAERGKKASDDRKKWEKSSEFKKGLAAVSKDKKNASKQNEETKKKCGSKFKKLMNLESYDLAQDFSEFELNNLAAENNLFVY